MLAERFTRYALWRKTIGRGQAGDTGHWSDMPDSDEHYVGPEEGPRPRACGALIDGDRILMVRYRTASRTFWTLPGGGINSGETAEQAVVREFLEETGLNVSPMRMLHRGVYVPVNSDRNGIGASADYCFLVALDQDSLPHTAMLGADPEEDHLPTGQRSLCGLEWRSITEMSDDAQVKIVIEKLALTI